MFRSRLFTTRSTRPRRSCRRRARVKCSTRRHAACRRRRHAAIGLVATYARWKGQDVFLEAASRLRRSNSGLSVRFYVVGGADLSNGRIAVFAGRALCSGAVARCCGSGWFRPVSGFTGRGVSSPRHRRSREHAAGAVRADDRRGDGLRASGHRVERRRGERAVHRWRRCAGCQAGRCGCAVRGYRAACRIPGTAQGAGSGGAGNGGAAISRKQPRRELVELYHRVHKRR